MTLLDALYISINGICICENKMCSDLQLLVELKCVSYMNNTRKEDRS